MSDLALHTQCKHLQLGLHSDSTSLNVPGTAINMVEEASWMLVVASQSHVHGTRNPWRGCGAAPIHDGCSNLVNASW
jgi:hypothetical protein